MGNKSSHFELEMPQTPPRNRPFFSQIQPPSLMVYEPDNDVEELSKRLDKVEKATHRLSEIGRKLKKIEAKLEKSGFESEKLSARKKKIVKSSTQRSNRKIKETTSASDCKL